MSGLMIPDAENGPQRRPAGLLVLAILVLLEGAALTALAVVLAVDVVVGGAESLTAAIALTAVTGVLAAGVIAIGIGALRAQPWIRGAAVTVQVLQIVVAIGSLQGAFARPGLGFLLLAPAVAVLVLLFTPPVLAATLRRDDDTVR